MDVKAKNELLKLIESAISECVRVGQDALSNGQQWMEEDAKTSQSQFEKIRYQLLNDTLPRSDGAGLGITRALSEWAPKSLYDAGLAVEEYYIRTWN